MATFGRGGGAGGTPPPPHSAPRPRRSVHELVKSESFQWAEHSVWARQRLTGISAIKCNYPDGTTTKKKLPSGPKKTRQFNVFYQARRQAGGTGHARVVTFVSQGKYLQYPKGTEGVLQRKNKRSYGSISALGGFYQL